MKTKSKTTRATRTVLQFDENARKEYLTGFRKRKVERRKHYEEKLLKRLKEEQQELKRQRRAYGKQPVSLSRDPVVMEEAAPSLVTDLLSHTVTTTDIASVDFSSQLYLGLNTQTALEPAKPVETAASRKKYQHKMEEVRRLEMKVAGLSGKRKKGRKSKAKAKSGGAARRKRQH